MSADRDALRAWLSMLRSAEAIKKASDAKFRARFGLSLSRFDVLATLQRAGPEGLRAGELSQRLMVTEGNVTQVTASLTKDGLIRRLSSPQDGRVAIFQLTRKGEKLFLQMAEEHRGWVADVFADATPAQLAAFRKFLSKLNLPDRTEARSEAP